MKIHCFGCRGTVQRVTRHPSQYGGHTTCYALSSACLPAGIALFLDAGSGLPEANLSALGPNISRACFLMTHWHYDHIMGLTTSALTYIPTMQLTVVGPEEPKTVLGKFFSEPFFPVDFSVIAHRVTGISLNAPGKDVLVFHPTGGMTQTTIDQLRSADQHGHQLLFNGNRWYDLHECLVVKTFRANHPQMTFSYRFEERPTGKVFVFLTDHEGTDGISIAMKHYVDGADLLTIDCQYADEGIKTTAGFGHGHPVYCADLALAGRVTTVGLTHHAPESSDEAIEALAETVSALSPSTKVFAWRDGMVHDLT